jgi:CBS domain-containing protein/RNA polymerase-binding transcription factor DksA
MQTPVKSLMTGSPIAIEADTSALAGLDLMVEHGFRHLPVIDAGRRVVGVVSLEDLRAAFPIPVSLRRPPSAEQRSELRDLPITEVMSYAPQTITAEVALEDAVQQLTEQRIGCLPVVDGEGRLEGIFTETDALQALATVLFTDQVREKRRDPAAAAGPGDLVTRLRDEHARLAARLQGYERHEQDLTALRREIPLDLPEQASDVTEAGLTEGLADLAAKRLHDLEHALERAEEGRLEICEACAGAIAPGRLRVLPGTTLCVECAREREAR